MNKEVCDKCPWKNQKNCGRCQRDRDRKEFDKKQEWQGINDNARRTEKSWRRLSENKKICV